MILYLLSSALGDEADGLVAASSRKVVLQLFNLPVIQFNGSAATENIDDHGHSTICLINLLDFAFQILEVTFFDTNSIACAIRKLMSS